MTREDIENNIGYWQEKANLEYIRQRQEHGVNDPYMITEINEAFDVGFDKGYQYALQHPQWIPVEERKPPIVYHDDLSENHLVVDSDGEPLIAYYDAKNGLWFSVDSNPEICDVTHWMEIVPPRKEE